MLACQRDALATGVCFSNLIDPIESRQTFWSSIVLETTSYRVQFPGGSSGVTLAGIVDRPLAETGHADDESARPPVAIFSHCFTCNKDLKATVRICRALAKAGVAVLRFDMTGLGGSSGDFSQTNFTTNLADLTSAIEFANQELGEINALIGHSFGGVASLVTAANSVDESYGVTLPRLGFVAAIASPSDTHHLATLLNRMNPEIDSVGSGEVTIGGITWTITRQMLEDFRRHDITQVLPNVPCPVLLMHSPADQTVHFDHALRLMNLIHDPQPSETKATVSMVALPDADHLLVKNPADLTFVSEMLAAWCHRFAITSLEQ